MTILDELIVTAAKQSLTGALSQGLSSSIGSSLGSSLAKGMFTNLKFSDPKLQGMVDQYKAQNPDAFKTQQQGPTQATPPPEAAAPAPPAQPAPQPGANPQPPSSLPSGGYEVAPVEVFAPAAKPALANIVAPGAGSALAGLLAGAGRSPMTSAAAPQQPTGDGGYEVAGLDVFAPSNQGSGPLTPMSLATSSLPSLGRDQLIQPANPQDLQPVEQPTLEQQPEANHDKEKLAAAAAAGGGLGLLGGLSMRDLIAGGLLGAGLLANGSGGGSGTAKEAEKGLQDAAKTSGDLAKTLSGVGQAGLAGNIGGMGMQSIARQVRKAQAAIRQRYSAMGMSGSTAEMQDLQAAAESGVDLQFKIGQDIAKTGLAAVAALSGQSASAYLQLLNAATAKDTQLGNALANFAGALVR